MAREITQRQRAEAVVDTVKAELPPIWLGGRQRMVLVDEITQALTTARQEALRDVQDEIERFIDYSGGCVGTKNNLEVVAVNRFIELTVRPLLARLAREGVKG